MSCLISAHYEQSQLYQHCANSAIVVFGTLRVRQNEPRHEKANILVSDLVQHKPGCTATEDG